MKEAQSVVCDLGRSGEYDVTNLNTIKRPCATGPSLGPEID
jgi:hypothetical protein